MVSKYTLIVIFFFVYCVNAYSIQVSIPEFSVEPNANITVAINVDNAAGIAGGDIVLEYEPDILVAKEARKTDLIESLTLIANTDIEGKIVLSMAGTSGLEEGSGAILEIDFEVKANAKADSPLILSDVALYDEIGNDIPVGTVNGKVTVQKSETPTKKYPPWDVNDDGVVDIFDLMLVSKHFGEDYRTEKSIETKIGVPSGKKANAWMGVQNKVGVGEMRLLIGDINVKPISHLYSCQFDLAFNTNVSGIAGIKFGNMLVQDNASTYWNISKINNRKVSALSTLD